MKATRYETSMPDYYSRTISEPNIRNKENIMKEIPRMRRCTTGDIRKHVHWSDRSRVILVPCRQDYSRNGFVHDMWWERNDYDLFKSSAQDEVISVMQSKNIDLSTAISELYQPSEELEQEENQEQIQDNEQIFDEFREVTTNNESSELNENLVSSDLNISYQSPKSTEDFLIRSETPKPSPSRALLQSPSRSYSRQGSRESVDSQTSTNSGERRTINFFEIRSEKGLHDNGQAIQVKKDSTKKFIHPLAYMADI